MNSIQIRKAVRKKAKLRLGIAAPSGAGKTYSALLMAFGIGGPVGVIDTEHGSADLYSDMGDYDIINIESPYTVDKYRAAIKAFEDAGYNIIIIDSLSHAWAGDGGLLDKQGKIADASPSGNSYTAWRKVTPEHNALVEAMLSSPCHIIATMRSKQDYVQEQNDKGKTVVKKVGMAPVQRDGMEYEFTTMLEIDMNHVANATKDRTRLFDGQYFKIEKKHGAALLNWLDSGEEAPQKVSSSERDEILELLDDSGLSAMRFCAKYAINQVGDLLRSDLQGARDSISEFKAAREEKQKNKQQASDTQDGDGGDYIPE